MTMKSVYLKSHFLRMYLSYKRYKIHLFKTNSVNIIHGRGSMEESKFGSEIVKNNNIKSKDVKSDNTESNHSKNNNIEIKGIAKLKRYI